MDEGKRRREALARAAAGWGLLGLDVASSIRNFGMGMERPRTTTFEVEGLGTALLVLCKSSGEGEPFHGGTVDAFYALVGDGDEAGGGAPLAYLRAGVMRPTRDVVSCGSGHLLDALVDMADQSWHVQPGHMTQVAKAVGNVAEAFEGGAMVVLDTFSRDLARTPPGSGAKLLGGALAAYASSRRVKLGSVAYGPSPRPSPAVPGPIQTASFKEASRALRASVDAAILGMPAKGKARPPRPIAWTPAEGTSAHDPGIVSLAAMQAGHHPESRGESPRDRAIRLTGVVMRMAGMQGAWTKAKDGPPPLQPREFPAGFDVRVAATFPSLDPRRELWDHVHGDVAAVTVIPTGRWEDGQAGFGRPGPDGRTGRPSLVLKVEFANGTELDMPSEHMLWGTKVLEIVPDLLEEAGSIILDNPFAPGFKTMAMNDTLAVNLAMLFSCDPHHVEEIEETRFERPA